MSTRENIRLIARAPLKWVLNLFRFYMTIDIAYFLYICVDNGANML